jgi:DNA polymerase II small subunit/DNA polymerase delta subunit B
MEERRLRPEAYRHLSLEAAAKDIALKWKAMDGQAKNKYLHEFSASSKLYEKEKRNLKVQLIKGHKVKSQKKKAHQPFVAFIKDHYNSVKAAIKGSDHKSVMSKLSEKWKLLTPEEKEAYKIKVSEMNK